MKAKFVTLCAAILLGVSMIAGAATGLAQDIKKPGGFPKRPVTMIVPFSVGGGGDTLARALAPLMEKVMDGKIRIVNKPGAGGVAGTTEFMTMPDDGYTILEQSDSLLTAITGGRIDIAMDKDVVPICLVQRAYSQIYMRPDENRFKDWISFVEYAKTHDVTMANDSGVGSMEHVASIALVAAAGVDILQVNTALLSERVSSLIGGHVDILFEQPGDTGKYIRAGQMKPMLTLLKTRAAEYPDAPSLPEVGLEKVEPLVRVRGLFVRSGVPEERRNYLEAVCKAAYETEEFQAFNKKKAVPPDSYYSAQETRETFKGMADTYAFWYKKLGVGKK